MRILFATDFHLDAAPAGYDLFNDTVAAMNVIAIEAGACSLVVLGGDLFHCKRSNPRPSPRAYEAVLNLLNDIPCPVIVLQGNHDEGALGPLGTVRSAKLAATGGSMFDLETDAMLTSETKVLVATRPEVVGVCGKALLLAPYMPQSASETPLPDVYEAMFQHALDEGVVAAFCHLDVPGARGPGGFDLPCGPAAVPPAARRMDVPIMNGHIHVPQVVGNVTMVGSLVPVAFGEAGQRRVAVLEV